MAITQDNTIALAALHLAATQGTWEAVTLPAIALEAKIDLPQMRVLCPNTDTVWEAIATMIDAQVLERMGSTDNAMPLRDRLFDILMERFEVMNGHRAGLEVMMTYMTHHPYQMVRFAPILNRSMGWMLRSAGAKVIGLRSFVQCSVVMTAYSRALWTWRNDTSPDLAATMAILDIALTKANYIFEPASLFSSIPKKSYP